MAASAQKLAVRTLMTSLPAADRPRSSAMGAIRSSGNSKDMLDITNLEEFQFDDSATVIHSEKIICLWHSQWTKSSDTQKNKDRRGERTQIVTMY